MIRHTLPLRAFALSMLLLAVPAFHAGAAATVGEPAPPFTLTDARGEEHSLEDYRGKVVVLEWINPHCPFSERHARQGTMSGLAESHDEVIWLAINSTHPRHGDYLPPEKHLAFNRETGIDYPVLYDESGEVGHAYDAKTTPHMYVIDEEGILVYQGAIDDDPLAREDADERNNFVASALEDHAAGHPVEPATTKPYGCTVKY